MAMDGLGDREGLIAVARDHPDEKVRGAARRLLGLETKR